MPIHKVTEFPLPLSDTRPCSQVLIIGWPKRERTSDARAKVATENRRTEGEWQFMQFDESMVDIDDKYERVLTDGVMTYVVA